jgi:heme/copper-type cytochrome/quinol oxidase subunit 2
VILASVWFCVALVTAIAGVFLACFLIVVVVVERSRFGEGGLTDKDFRNPWVVLLLVWWSGPLVALYLLRVALFIVYSAILGPRFISRRLRYGECTGPKGERYWN